MQLGLHLIHAINLRQEIPYPSAVSRLSVSGLILSNFIEVLKHEVDNFYT